MTAAEFITIWKAWDKRPSAPMETDRMVAADVEVGAQLGMSHVQLRARLATARREGKSYEAAVEEVGLSS